MAMKRRMKGGPRHTITSLQVMTKAIALWPTATEGDAAAAGNRNLEGSKAHPGTSLTDAVNGGQRPRINRDYQTPLPDETENAYWKRMAEHEKAHGITPEDLSDGQAWPTPRSEDSESSGARLTRGDADTLTSAARLWPTASSRDWKDTPGMATTGTNPDGSERSRVDQLARAVFNAGPPAPESPNTNGSRPGWSTPHAGIAEGTTSGAGRVHRGGSRDLRTDTFTPGGALNPDWVSCLMGFPVAWLHGIAAPASRRSGTRSSPKSRKQSGGRS
jgi:hypothetical protein